MSKQVRNGTSVESLMKELASKDGATRMKARKALATLGKPAVSSLMQALENSQLDHLRWEAAKTLGAIRDARAIPILVKALEDRDPDVAWLAAEALIMLKKTAWAPLLHELIKSGSDSVSLRQGVHHVLCNQKERGFNDQLATLMKNLESDAATESAPVAAYDILKRMKTTS